MIKDIDHLESVVVDGEARVCKFVLFVAEDREGARRFFIRGRNQDTHDHPKILKEFYKEEVQAVPGVIFQNLGGAFISVISKEKHPSLDRSVILLTMSSENLGKIQNKEEMLRLLQEKYPGFLVNYTGLY